MSILIDPVFNGPPESGNGGYVAGLMGDLLSGEGPILFETSLKAPPPLNKPLDLGETGQGLALLEDGKPVATARLLDHLELAMPALPDPVVNNCAVSLATGFDNCFVCGTARDTRSGLCLHATQQPPPSNQWIAPFSVNAAFCDSAGTLGRRFLIAALDCPGYAAVSNGALAVLARFRVRVTGALKAGDAAHVYAWPISQSGRKLVAGTAIKAPDGKLVGEAEALWIKITADQLRAAS